MWHTLCKQVPQAGSAHIPLAKMCSVVLDILSGAASVRLRETGCSNQCNCRKDLSFGVTEDSSCEG